MRVTSTLRRLLSTSDLAKILANYSGLKPNFTFNGPRKNTIESLKRPRFRKISSYIDSIRGR